MTNYKAWFEKYRPLDIKDIVFPNEDIQKTLTKYWDNEFINGNILSFGPAGLGKTTISEVLIKRIIKDRNDVFILGRKTEDIDNLRRWLQQGAVHSNQKIVKIEEMDRLSFQAQVILKDGLMEKFQHNTSFLATTNNPEKIDPALLTRFNIKINFGELPAEKVFHRLKMILDLEKIIYEDGELWEFVNKYVKRGLRELINNLELSVINQKFDSTRMDSFIGSSGSEDNIIQYIVYLIKYIEALEIDKLQSIIKDPRSDQNFYNYYYHILNIFKNEIDLNWHYIYKELFYADLDMSVKNIIENYWQDLDLKRFKHTHTVALIHEILINNLNQRN